MKDDQDGAGVSGIPEPLKTRPAMTDIVLPVDELARLRKEHHNTLSLLGTPGAKKARARKKQQRQNRKKG